MVSWYPLAKGGCAVSGDMEAGLARVSARERNNRRSERAKGRGAKVPRLAGAKSGFRNNRTNGHKIVMRTP